MVEIQLEGPAKNALSVKLMEWLQGRLHEAAGEPVLLTGAGDAFCAGLNLEEVGSLDADSMVEFIDRLDALCVTLFDYPAPTVAALNGHAIAGGAVLALCCDHIVATTHPRARFGLNEVALGVRFPPAILSIVRHRLPSVTARRVLLGASLYPPEHALSLGLADELADDPLEIARERLELLASHPPLAYAATKTDLQLGVTDISDEDRAAWHESSAALWTSPELRARIDTILGR